MTGGGRKQKGQNKRYGWESKTGTKEDCLITKEKIKLVCWTPHPQICYSSSVLALRRSYFMTTSF